MNTTPDGDNLELTYPRPWRYQVIGEDEEQLRRVIAAAVADHEHTVTLARSSRTGKYCSLHLELIVLDEPHRNGIFRALRGHREVRFVL